ncbi:MAG: peroxidase family protein, partial [Pseudomonadota bacterium]
YKLNHRDMGPTSRYLGADVPSETLVWQDPVPAVDHDVVDDADVASLKAKLLDSGLSVQELVATAWASASTYRGSDKRGGANGARIRLAPQKDWEANNPDQLSKVLGVLEGIQSEFNGASGSKRVSLADLIVLGGTAAVEKAAKDAGVDLEVGFTPGRTDATDEMTDVDSFAVLEPVVDGFRNYMRGEYARSAEEMLVDKAQLLTLGAPEMTVLVGGLRALDANAFGAKHGVFTDKPGTLTNDYFVNLLDRTIVWEAKDESASVFEGRSRDGEKTFTGTRVDLVFGSNSQLRGIAEVYAASDAKEKFAKDFARAWQKVMELDRFDVQ